MWYLLCHVFFAILATAFGYYLFSRFCNYSFMSRKGVRRIKIFLFTIPVLQLLLFGAELVLWLPGRGTQGIPLPMLFLGASPYAWLMLAAGLSVGMVGVYFYFHYYRKPFLELKKRLGTIGDNYGDYVKTARKENFTRNWIQFLEDARARAPLFAKANYRRALAELEKIKRNFPREVLLHNAAASMRHGNRHKAISYLQEWRKGWDETHKAMEELESLLGGEGDNKDDFLQSGPWVKKEREASTLDRALDFAQVYDEPDRSRLWQRGKEALEAGRLQQLRDELADGCGDWREAWNDLLHRRLTDLLLLSIEMRNFVNISPYLQHINCPALQSEVNQMIAYSSKEGTAVFEEALERLRMDATVGMRRIAFIKYNKGEADEAKRLLSHDMEARLWFSTAESET